MLGEFEAHMRRMEGELLAELRAEADPAGVRLVGPALRAVGPGPARASSQLSPCRPGSFARPTCYSSGMRAAFSANHPSKVNSEGLRSRATPRSRAPQKSSSKSRLN